MFSSSFILYMIFNLFLSWSSDLNYLCYHRIFAGTGFCHWFVIGYQFMKTNGWIFSNFTETKIFHLITKSDHSCIPPGLNHRSYL